MRSQRNTGAFVAGSVIGGLLGAVLALWKTPKSGAELRAGISLERDNVVTYRPETDRADIGTVEREQRFSNPVLSFVERAAAPIVGVELGKLAKDDPNAAAATPVRTSSADARPPTTPGAQPVAGEPVQVPGDSTQSGFAPRDPGIADTTPSGAAYTSPATVHGAHDATDGDEDVVNPDEAATHDSEEGSSAPAATTEDLTHPAKDYVDELTEKRAIDPTEGTDADFPDLPSQRDTTGNR